MLMRNLKTESDLDTDLLTRLLAQDPVDYRYNAAFLHSPKTTSRSRPAKKLFKIQVDMNHAGRFWSKLDANLALNPKNREPIPIDKGILLTGEQEKIIFLQMNYARHRVHLRQLLYRKRSEGIWPFKLTFREERDLLKWYHLSQRLLHDIVNANLGLVGKMLQYFNITPDIVIGDMVAEGRFALMRAADKFDVGRGVRFSTYACNAIFKSFSRSFQKRNKYHSKFVVHSQTDHFEHQPVSVDVKESENRDRREISEHLHMVLRRNDAGLTLAQQRVISMRFPMNSNVKRMTLAEVGKAIGVSKERTRQIQNRALERMKETLDSVFH